MNTPNVPAALAGFAAAAPDRLDAGFAELTARVWHDGALAADLVPELVDLLAVADDARAGRLAVLLGLLAEEHAPGSDVHTLVAKGLDTYLDVLDRHGDDEPVTLGLLYLVAHFPADAERILAAVAHRNLTAEDRSRFERCLEPYDRENLVLGRVWPSPSEWALTDAEREFDRRWVAELPDAQAKATWDGDTKMVLGYAGAHAYWAQLAGTPVVAADTNPLRDAVPAEASDDGLAGITRHAAVLRCPVCHGPLTARPEGARCPACPGTYPLARGVLDFTADPTRPVAADDPDDVLSNAAAMNSIGLYYEVVLRPGFLRLMGTNWGGQVTPADEDEYLARHLSPVSGTVLDLAAGAGRWTAVLAELLGAGRLVALDLNPTMLSWLRGRLPEVCAVQASALDLPFADASFGGVNCWNALQAMPDPAQAIAEAGRVLQPGGTFTLLTFGEAEDPVLAYYQSTFRGPGFPDGGMPLFSKALVRSWVEAAGLVIRDESGPGSFIFVTAEKPA
jgi:hypothetical protein